MTKKKDKKMLSEMTFSKEEMEWATQVVQVLDKMMEHQHPEARFEHLAFWWAACEPADA